MQDVARGSKETGFLVIMGTHMHQVGPADHISIFIRSLPEGLAIAPGTAIEVPGVSKAVVRVSRIHRGG